MTTISSTNSQDPLVVAFTKLDRAYEILKTKEINSLYTVNGNVTEVEKIEGEIKAVFQTAIKYFKLALASNLEKKDESQLIEKKGQVFKAAENALEKAKLAKAGKFVPLNPLTPPITKEKTYQAPTLNKVVSNQSQSPHTISNPSQGFTRQKKAQQESLDSTKKELPTSVAHSFDKKETLLSSTLKAKHKDPNVFKDTDTTTQPVGIQNINGTDCFVNSTLQFIFHIPALRDVVLNDQYKEKKCSEELIESIRTLADSYHEKMLKEYKGNLSSVGIRMQLPKYLHRGQYDATEVFSHIMSQFNADHLYSTYTNKRSLNKEKAIECPYKNPLLATNHELATQDKLLITDIDIFHPEPILIPQNDSKPTQDSWSFWGYLFGPSKSSPQYIYPESQLEVCFNKTLENGEFSATDTIYYLESTDGKTYASTIKSGTKEPSALNPHLFLRIKRYNYTYGKPTKIQTPIAVPETFKGKHLKGFMQHSGSANGGHWVTYIKKNLNGQDKWFCISDSNVYEVTEDAALKQAKTSDLLYYAS